MQNANGSRSSRMGRWWLMVSWSLLLVSAFAAHGQPATSNVADCSTLSACLALLPEPIRIQLAREISASIDRLTAEHEAAIVALKAEAVRTYEPRIRSLEAQVAELEGYATEQGLELALLDWSVGLGLVGIGALQLILAPSWDDALPLVAGAGWLVVRVVLPMYAVGDESAPEPPQIAATAP